MDVSELDISREIVDALREQGYVTLHPPQVEALPKALAGDNLVVAVPTASGKSLIAYITALKAITEKGKKVLYIVPLKALASEKKDDMDRFAQRLGFKTAISIGDLDSEDRWLNDADFIVATSEKADSLIRHGSKLIDDIGLVIADEIHLIHDPSRGPTLEVALTKLKRRHGDMQIIALSATISNANDLAMWLDADLVRMDWRPIPLHEGVYYNWEVTFENGVSLDVPQGKDDIWEMVHQTIEDGGQCIIFVNSRRSTESLAVKYSVNMKSICGRSLTDEEKTVIEGDADTTALGRKLSACVACGMAFHNAGLTARQRKYVEDNFRNGNIKCIVATPTLAAGINLPARRVIVRDTKRFESNSGNTPIPVMEIKQMCGRAGRPGYDPYGEAILVAKSYDDYENLMDNYVQCDTESIMSKLGNEKILRNHVLGLIATGDASSAEDVISFIRDTFYGSESELYGIESAVENIIDFLVEKGMVERFGEDVGILPFGKRVSDLYIDPESAVILKEAVEKIDDDTEDFPILLAVAMTPDVMGLYPKKKDEDRLAALEQEWEGRMLIDPPDYNAYEYEYFLGDLKTAALIMEWISETDEDTITEAFGIGPGDIRSRVDMMDWLLYAMSEISVIYRPECTKMLRNIIVRVRYGIGKELMELVSLKGVGRARARILYDRGIRTLNDIAAKDVNELGSIPGIGMALANRIKEQTGGRQPKQETYVPTPIDEEEAVPVPSGPKQKNLFDF
ncbi:MAG: DEAD/DEAH box helicase [Candidatus Methanomethylophilaceae archaeon]|nr:DEAD/DEAH box helicase [Candidatus Methanomethylophilaceae archaeon]